MSNANTDPTLSNSGAGGLHAQVVNDAITRWTAALWEAAGGADFDVLDGGRVEERRVQALIKTYGGRNGAYRVFFGGWLKSSDAKCVPSCFPPVRCPPA